MQGVWTLDELHAAEAQGTRVLKILELWFHPALDQQPFLPWLAAVQTGRALPDRFAALLAKLTGNALWGRFAVTEDNGRGLLSFSAKGGRLYRPLADRAGSSYNRDSALAEAVAGAVRARLGTFMNSAGSRLVCAHTDGGWLQPGTGFEPPDPQWRPKARADRLELIAPQMLKYVTHGRPRFVVAGVPPSLAEETFQRVWEGRLAI